MTKTYTAVDPLGDIHTQRSRRFYSHLVVHKMNLRERREFALSDMSRRLHAYNHAFYVWCVTTSCKGSEEQMAPFIEEAASLTVEEYVDRRVKDELTRINTFGFGDFSDNWYVAGWCSRLDLAEELARQYEVAFILEASVKE